MCNGVEMGVCAHVCVGPYRCPTSDHFWHGVDWMRGGAERRWTSLLLGTPGSCAGCCWSVVVSRQWRASQVSTQPPGWWCCPMAPAQVAACCLSISLCFSPCDSSSFSQPIESLVGEHLTLKVCFKCVLHLGQWLWTQHLRLSPCGFLVSQCPLYLHPSIRWLTSRCLDIWGGRCLWRNGEEILWRQLWRKNTLTTTPKHHFVPISVSYIPLAC